MDNVISFIVDLINKKTILNNKAHWCEQLVAH